MLNKILLFSDFLAFAELGEPITGFEYQKLPNGPAPRRSVPIRQAMTRSGELGMQELRLRNGRMMHKIVNLRAPNLALFSAAQISLVDSVIEVLAGADADAVSELSHRLMGWKVAQMGGTIPYETIFLSNEALSDDDIQRRVEVAREFGVLAD
ncbi:MAG: Panacea domain-containing protein [Acidobacteriota bacterium]|nr:Panacea domain-containing protein [Acidobacteriota bacterium]